MKIDLIHEGKEFVVWTWFLETWSARSLETVTGRVPVIMVYNTDKRISVQEVSAWSKWKIFDDRPRTSRKEKNVATGSG